MKIPKTTIWNKCAGNYAVQEPTFRGDSRRRTQIWASWEDFKNGQSVRAIESFATNLTSVRYAFALFHFDSPFAGILVCVFVCMLASKPRLCEENRATLCRFES